MSADQRKDRRVDIRQGIWVEGQDLRIHAETRNMSKGGMFVVAPQGTAQLGQTLEIQFEDPKEGAIKVQMEVVWRDEATTTSKLGLKALDSRGKAAFDRVVTRYLDDPEEAPAEGGDRDGQGDGKTEKK